MQVALNAIEKSRLQELQKVVKEGLDSFIGVGAALLEIRTSRLYRETHKTFADYCEEKFGLTSRRINMIVSRSEVLSAFDLGTTGSQFSPKPETEQHAAALASVPPSDRPGVWKAALAAAPKDKNGEPKVTAKIIKEAAAEVAKKDDDIPIDPPAKPATPAAPAKPPVDRVGQPLPNDRIVTAFNRSREIKDLMRSVSDVRTTIERGMDKAEKDPIFYPINFNQFKAHCLNAYRELKQCQPHAVCPYCGGDGCRVCAQQGWVNELTYTNYVPQDLKV